MSILDAVIERMRRPEPTATELIESISNDFINCLYSRALNQGWVAQWHMPRWYDLDALGGSGQASRPESA